MAVNLGTEFALALHFDRALSYGDIESAVVGAGFTDYTIMRTVNFDHSSDVQLFVRSPMNSDGSEDVLPAADTVTQLGEVVTALEASEDAVS